MGNKSRQNYTKSFSTIICLLAYCAAGAAAYISGVYFSAIHAIGVAAIADVAATAIIFSFSKIFDNSSIYDPYWSVIPFFIGLYWGIQVSDVPAWGARSYIVLALVCAWGIRLTFNWYSNWPGLQHEDWRYDNFRKTSGKWYWVVSFFGIHLFPTVIVFLGCLSIYPVMNRVDVPVGIIDVLAITVTAGAIIIEGVSDWQLHRFVKTKPGKGAIMSGGLWAYSRHPNYFGEIAFWWGLYIFSLAAGGFRWWTVIGPVAMTVMFVGVSIPLMERRMMERRKGYAEHMRRVSMLVPWFHRGK